jgi:hypothetical protein
MTDIAESMGSVGRHFAQQKARTRGPLQSQRDLEEVLKLWMGQRDFQIPLGNLKPVWGIMMIEGLQEIDELERYFNGIFFDTRLKKRHFAPLPHTVAIYLIEVMLVRPWDQESRDRAMQAKQADEIQRDKIRIIRDSFLWLRDLLGFAGIWSKELFPTLDVNSDVQRESAIRQKLSWLQNEEPRSFLQQSRSRTVFDQESESKINDLWNIFVGSHSLSVKYAFRLAQLGAKGSWEPNGDGGRVSDEWSEYNQVISGLLLCKARYSSKQ